MLSLLLEPVSSAAAISNPAGADGAAISLGPPPPPTAATIPPRPPRPRMPSAICTMDKSPSCSLADDHRSKKCLNTHSFLSLANASGKIRAWRRDYTGRRPHTYLG